MAMSRAEINEASNERRGIKQKSFKLSVDTIVAIEELSAKHGMSQARLVSKLIELAKLGKIKL
jgi:hypothetical protein